jgi:hypothetical protein
MFPTIDDAIQEATPTYNNVIPASTPTTIKNIRHPERRFGRAFGACSIESELAVTSALLQQYIIRENPEYLEGA